MDYVLSTDYIQPIFSPDFIQQDDEKLGLSSNIFPCGQDQKRCDQIAIDADSGRRRKAPTAFENEGEQDSEKRWNKKMKHREIERLRRQEQGTLFKILRSLLPLDYIKGKRSASDNVQEAVNYIKDLKNKIQELREKRDGFRRLSELEHNVPGSPSSTADQPHCSSSCSSCLNDTVVVTPCLAGIQIIVSTCCKRSVCLSRVLGLLVDGGLSVVSCTSRRGNEKFVLTITSEVNNMKSINLSTLQEKIMKTKI